MKYSNIVEKIINFRNVRDWEQFHTPKNLAISISIEASELLEKFQWSENFNNIEELKDEIADIMIYLMLLSKSLEIDLMDAVEKKIEKNEIKYPIEKAKGNSKKYTEFD